MGRNQKLYERLDQLEDDFASYLLEELESVASGHSSWFLSRKIPHHLDGKFWRDAKTAVAERTEAEIYELRKKLNESTSDGLLAILAEFVETRRQLSDKFDGGETHLARRIIEKLKEWQNMRPHVTAKRRVT
ncbi:MAG: hypothetical protein NC238_08800 [Dehalobacter sp.]|nr:hypothetical protein [Dehalobacter sp.]